MELSSMERLAVKGTLKKGNGSNFRSRCAPDGNLCVTEHGRQTHYKLNQQMTAKSIKTAINPSGAEVTSVSLF
jgi:hypothetical protein